MARRRPDPEACESQKERGRAEELVRWGCKKQRGEGCDTVGGWKIKREEMERGINAWYWSWNSPLEFPLPPTLYPHQFPSKPQSFVRLHSPPSTIPLSPFLVHPTPPELPCLWLVVRLSRILVSLETHTKMKLGLALGIVNSLLNPPPHIHTIKFLLIVGTLLLSEGD